MAVLAQNMGYYNSPENPLDPDLISQIPGFEGLAQKFQSGLSSTTNDSKSASNVTNFSFATTAHAGSFASDEDFIGYGAKKDAESYAADSDREMAVEEQEPQFAMGKDLNKLSQLNGKVPHGAISRSLDSLNEHSVDEMKKTFDETGELTRKAAEPKNIAEQQAQQHARDFQLAMSMDNGEMAKNGLDATYKGMNTTFEKGVGATQMIMS